MINIEGISSTEAGHSTIISQKLIMKFSILVENIMVAGQQALPNYQIRRKGYDRNRLSTEDAIVLGNAAVWERYQELIKFFNNKIKNKLENYLLRAPDKEIALEEIRAVFNGMVYVKDSSYMNGGKTKSFSYNVWCNRYMVLS